MRKELLKSYIERLNAGEALETVRRDFVKEFQNVDANEIMEAEQEMIAAGLPVSEVQRLCDVHSALFHEVTKVDYSDKREAAAKLAAIKGHPLQIFTLENERLTQLIQMVREGFTQGKDISGLLEEIHDLAIHYAKKGDLIYPLLKVNYGISGPSEVMWSVDDEIRNELRALTRLKHDEEWQKRVLAVLERAEEMIYKEANILFPICAKNFTEIQWKQIYQEFSGYDKCFVEEVPVWEDALHQAPPAMDISPTDIVFPSGHLTIEQLTAMLNTIPLEITFIDENSINRYYNEGWKLFKRPLMSLDRQVFSCHPPKIEVMVRTIIEDFRNNRRDSVPVWMEKKGSPMLVTYLAVRDKSGKYLGTLEIIQNMEFAKKHFQK